MIESPNDKVMQEDLEDLADGGFPCESFQNTTALITGATGLIGAQIVKALACTNRLKQAGIRILAHVRNPEKAERMFGELLTRGDVFVVAGDMERPIDVDGPVDYIIHGASATSSKYFVTNPVETIFTAIDGTRHVLKLAKEKQSKGMVYLSSLEVYGTPDKDSGLIAESDYGYIDPLNTRSSYSEGKRIVECLCASYAKEYGVPVKIARLSQTFGPGVSYDDGRVFAEFARCAAEGRDIVLHTQGNTVRSYCYTKDAVAAILTILAKGKAGEAYNVTNMDTAVSIREMAELVCRTIGNGGIKTTVEIPENLEAFGYNPEMVIKLDSTKLASLGFKPSVGLEEMYGRMYESAFQKATFKSEKD